VFKLVSGLRILIKPVSIYVQLIKELSSAINKKKTSHR